jgi:hypothetical protein
MSSFAGSTGSRWVGYDVTLDALVKVTGPVDHPDCLGPPRVRRRPVHALLGVSQDLPELT